VCPIDGVIHFNPGTEKVRGHLGSQMERKAETNLTLEKSSDEVTRIYSLKNRRAGIPKWGGPCFKYDPERQMHVTCDPEEWESDPKGGSGSGREARSDRARFTPEDVHNALVWSGIGSVTWSEFLNLVKTSCGMSKGSFQTNLARAIRNGTILKSAATGRYSAVIRQPPTT
jgi:hypothetical protein